MIIGEGRIEMPARGDDAGAHGAVERLLRPSPDPGLGGGRDVGGGDGAERRRDRQAAGIIRAAGCGMAGVAIADRCKTRPFLISAGSNDDGAGGAIAAIVGRQATANAATAPAINAAMTTVAMVRDDLAMPAI